MKQDEEVFLTKKCQGRLVKDNFVTKEKHYLSKKRNRIGFFVCFKKSVTVYHCCFCIYYFRTIKQCIAFDKFQRVTELGNHLIQYPYFTDEGTEIQISYVVYS